MQHYSNYTREEIKQKCEQYHIQVANNNLVFCLNQYDANAFLQWLSMGQLQNNVLDRKFTSLKVNYNLIRLYNSSHYIINYQVDGRDYQYISANQFHQVFKTKPRQIAKLYPKIIIKKRTIKNHIYYQLVADDYDNIEKIKNFLASRIVLNIL